MKYRNLTKDQEREVLENKITEIEARHRTATVELTAARAIFDVTPDDSTQHEASAREIDNLENNVESMEAALVALHQLAAKEIPNRRTRRDQGKQARTAQKAGDA